MKSPVYLFEGESFTNANNLSLEKKPFGYFPSKLQILKLTGLAFDSLSFSERF